MKLFPSRSGNTFLLVAILFVVSACSPESDEFHMPQNESELREFVIKLSKLKNASIKKQNSNIEHETAHQPIEDGAIDTMLVSAAVTKDGLGLDLKRAILQDVTPEQITALKELMRDTPDPEIMLICQSEQLTLMRKFGYHVRAQVYAQGDVLVSDSDIDYETCIKYLTYVEQQEMLEKQNSEDESKAIRDDETAVPANLEQARQQMETFTILIKNLQVENDDTCSIKNGQLCFEPVDAELAENEFFVTFTNRITESLGTEELEAISSLLKGGFDAQNHCTDSWLTMMKDFGMVIKVKWLSIENELFAESLLGETECKMALDTVVQ